MTDSYIFSGTLPENAPTYVKRKADFDLYEGLKSGQFCYVLNSRQTGKSSLRVQVMRQLKQAGVACSVIDISMDNIQQGTSNQWYANMLRSLTLDLQIEVNLGSWWRDREWLSPLGRFREFIETVVLVQIPGTIVIFIDEIDSILSLNFPTDDFFAFIRACYNQRAHHPPYNRLTFCLLGVATPSDLIADKQRTPFNIGQAIALHGFTLAEAKPALLPGLSQQFTYPETVLSEILDWTRGQPFLTQKLCKLVVDKAHNSRPNVGVLVKTYLLENWESQDEPDHLKTIRDRLLCDEKRTPRRLGLYQKILTAHPEGYPADNSPEQTQLRLSGLVVKHQGNLTVFNRIYQQIFNADWIENQLANLRPYSEAIAAWWESDGEDSSRLLRGQALQDALNWAADKSLSDRDYQFLSASQNSEKKSLELAKIETEITLEAERKAKQILNTAYKKAQRVITFGLVGLCAVSLLSITIIAWANSQKRQAEIAEIKALNSASKIRNSSNEKLEALVNAIRAGRKLQSNWATSELMAPAVVNLETILANLQEQNSLNQHNGWVWDVAWSPNGETLATASADGTAILWTAQGELLQTLEHGDRVYGLGFSPDGQTLATATANHSVKLWGINGTLLHTLSGHQGSVFAVSFSPQGHLLVTGSTDKTAKIWRIEPNSPTPPILLQTITAHTKEISDISFSPDGEILATASYDNQVKLWKITPTGTAELLTTLTGHQSGVSTVNFAPNGQTLATASGDGRVKLWTRDGELINAFKAHDNVVTRVIWSPNGNLLGTASEDQRVKLWSVYDSTLLKTLTAHSAAVWDIAWSPDGKTLASASGDNTTMLWNPEIRLIEVFQGHQDLVNMVSFSPDGEILASGSRDNTVQLWQQNGTLVQTLRGHSDWVQGVAFSPDGEAIASASRDQTVKLWDRQGKVLQTLRGHSDLVHSVNFSPEGDRLVSGSWDGTVKVWNRNGSLLETLTGHQGRVFEVKFSPKGKLIASTSADKTVKLWDSNTFNLAATLEGHLDEVNSVSFSPDEAAIATASDDNTVKIWSRNGQLLNTLEGHRDKVLWVSFSSDGKILASASDDRTVKIWSRQGRLLTTLEGHQNRIAGGSFSPDGQILASASWDQTVKLWTIADISRESLDGEGDRSKLDKLLTLACDRLHDYVTYTLQSSLCQPE